MTNKTLALLTFLAVSACGTPQPATTSALDVPLADPSSLRDLTAAEKLTLAKSLSTNFKDPSSAQYRWGKISKMDMDGNVTYCGMVNAKNSYGGYVGYKPFVALVERRDRKIVSGKMDGLEDLGEYGVIRRCRVLGLDPFASTE